MKLKKILCIVFLVQIFLVNLLSFFPETVERFYSNGLYPYLSGAERWLFGFFGFSVGDIIYGITILFLIRWLWSNRLHWKQHYKERLLTIGSFLCVFYFLFYFFWGLNYHRVPLNEKMGIGKKYEERELIAFTKRLIDKTNAVHKLLAGDSTKPVAVPYTAADIYKLAPHAYNHLNASFPQFAYHNPSIKSSLISTPLSYMGFGGYLNPFTNEAQVNCKLPLYNFPTTTCHEMAHQLGYASESEANFIGFLASVNSKDKYFEYSGYSFALKYCIRNIAKINKEEAERLKPLINKGILLNYEESEKWNDKYESFVETVFEFFYDKYLKLNHQEDGLETYSKFVGLMVNYYREKDL